jgi:hypothetical protein
MSVNQPVGPGSSDAHTGGQDIGDTREFGDLQVSTGAQSAYITVELILYALAVLGIFITAAVIDENGSGQGFGASEAWYYVTLLTAALFIGRGLARISGRNQSRAF